MLNVDRIALPPHGPVGRPFPSSLLPELLLLLLAQLARGLSSTQFVLHALEQGGHGGEGRRAEYGGAVKFLLSLAGGGRGGGLLGDLTRDVESGTRLVLGGRPLARRGEDWRVC